VRPALALLALAACGGAGQAQPDAGQPDASLVDATVDATPPADAPPSDAQISDLAHTFAPATVGPGEEQLGLCRSVTLDNDGELLVNAVWLAQDEALRASSWYAVPEALFAGPDGEWSCASRQFSGGAALAGGGVFLYAQSVDARADRQTLADGVAIRVPARARLVGTVHRLNATDEPVTGQTRIELFTVPAAATLVTPALLTYEGLALPPRETSRFSGTCALPITRVHYLLPNARGLATRVFARIVGGPLDGTTLLETAGPIPGASRGVTVAPPVDLSTASGVRFGCEYQNPRDETVHWGFGDQEMCEILAFVEAPAVATGTVQTAEPAGTEGAMQLFTGPCLVSP
jgi:hypothetical protein